MNGLTLKMLVYQKIFIVKYYLNIFPKNSKLLSFHIIQIKDFYSIVVNDKYFEFKVFYRLVK